MTILRRPGHLLLAWAVSTIIIIWAAPGYSVTPRLYTMDRDGEYMPIAGEVYAMPASGADDDDAIEPVPLSQYHTLSRAAGLGLMVTVAAYICLADCLCFKRDWKENSHARA